MNIEKYLQKRNIFVLPNRSRNAKPTNTTATTTNNTKPTYYKKPWSNQQPKPKMFNSFEYLQSSIREIQQKYEILSILLRSMVVRYMVLKGIEIQRQVLLTC